jgi:di/tricarboxylate transporter
LGDWLMRHAAGNESRLVILMMLLVGALGSIMSPTSVVAIFIPIVLRIAKSTGIPAGRLMMPLAFAALISGMMTLVSTGRNLVVHSELINAGETGFSFFSFTPFGALLLALAIAYMLLMRPWLAPGAIPPPKGPRRPSLHE